MIVSAVNICYDPLHQPFATEGAVKIQSLNSERPALKIIRAVLRDSDIDPEEAVNYSIHRCYCSFKIKIEEDDEDETFNPEMTLDELEIRDGDSVFIRKIDEGGEEKMDEMEEEQDETSLSRSNKRKERDEDEVTSQSSPLPSATAPDSNLENLAPTAAAAARTISKHLGGDAWRSQSIGKLGLIKTKSARCLKLLLRAVKTSLQIPQVATVEAGSFNSDLLEALTRAYHQRVGDSVVSKGGRNFFDLGVSDYEKANELLKGKIDGNGSWERSENSHLDECALSKAAERFPLSDSGLSGPDLTAARAVCVLWGNDKWVKQAPLPGLSPISLKDHRKNTILRQIAQLTRVKLGEATPEGFPPIVLKALRGSIKKNEGIFEFNRGGSQGGWSQQRCLKDALDLLKKSVAMQSSIPSIADPSSEVSGSRGVGKRNVRPRLV